MTNFNKVSMEFLAEFGARLKEIKAVLDFLRKKDIKQKLFKEEKEIIRIIKKELKNNRDSDILKEIQEVERLLKEIEEF